MNDPLRQGVERYLEAEGRLGFRKLGPEQAAETRGRGTAILLESFQHTQAFRAKVQWICVALLCLLFTVQAALLVSGAVTGRAQAGLVAGAGLLVLPVLSWLRRIWIDSVLEELIRSSLRDLPPQEALQAIERIHWTFFAPGRGARTRPALPPQEPGETGGEDVIPILFLTSDPMDAARLQLGKEARKIQERLRLSELRDRFELTQCTAARPLDIIQALLDTRPQIVHISGHGLAGGRIVLEDDSGQTHPVEASALANLFREFNGVVRCVLLSSCHSARQAKAIARHTEFAIGARGPIIDEAAIAFAVGFYQALGAGRSIEEAYRMGCAALKLEIPDQIAPALLKRSAA